MLSEPERQRRQEELLERATRLDELRTRLIAVVAAAAEHLEAAVDEPLARSQPDLSALRRAAEDLQAMILTVLAVARRRLDAGTGGFTAITVGELLARRVWAVPGLLVHAVEQLLVAGGAVLDPGPVLQVRLSPEPGERTRLGAERELVLRVATLTPYLLVIVHVTTSGQGIRPARFAVILVVAAGVDVRGHRTARPVAGLGRRGRGHQLRAGRGPDAGQPGHVAAGSLPAARRRLVGDRRADHPGVGRGA